MNSETSRSTLRGATPLPTSVMAEIPPNQWFETFGTWLTSSQRMLRSFSLLRIILGISILILVTTSFKDRHYMWGHASTWIDPATDARGWPRFFNIFPKDNIAVFDTLYWLLVLTLAVFTLGLHTRYVTPVLLLLWVGLSTNSAILTNGGDVVTRIILFFILFANLDEHWSLSAKLGDRRHRARRYIRWPLIPDYVKNAAHNSALIILMWQAILIYVNSGIFKLRGAEWRDGTALYYALNLDQFMVHPELSEIAWQITPFVFVGSFVGIWVQLSFPVMLLWKPTRYLGLALLMGMHLGIAVMFGLWPFSLAMVALDLLFIRDSSWERARNYAKERIPILKDRQAPAQSHLV